MQQQYRSLTGPNKWLWFRDTAASGTSFGSMQDSGTAPTAATSGTGFQIDASVTLPEYALMAYGSVVPSTAFGATVQPSAAPATADALVSVDSTGTPIKYTQTFADEPWIISLSFAPSVAAAITGQIRARVWRNTVLSGVGATEITLSTLTASWDATSGDNVNLVLSFQPGPLSLVGEYLFLQVADEVDTTSAFSPSSLSGLALWLNAAQGVTLSGSNVTAWADQSGNGNTFTNSAADTTVPAWSASGLNGHGAVQFDGVNDVMTAIDSTSLRVTEASLFFVVQFGTATVTGIHTLLSKGIASDYDTYYVDYADQLDYVSNGVGVASSASGISIGAACVVEIVRDAGGGISFYVNGVAKGTGSASAASFSANAATIGRRSDGSTLLTGYLGEVVAYNRAVTSAERASLEAYFRSTWGTP